MGRIEFNGTSCVHDQHAIRIDNGVQAMRHCQHGAFGEFDADRLLDESVGAVARRLRVISYADLFLVDPQWAEN